MAKKRQASIELLDKNISFKEKNAEYRLVRFNPSKMTLDVLIFENGEKRSMRDFPFAHLPREIKKLIKPN